jgi:Right handed beta helix region
MNLSFWGSISALGASVRSDMSRSRLRGFGWVGVCAVGGLLSCSSAGTAPSAAGGVGGASGGAPANPSDTAPGAGDSGGPTSGTAVGGAGSGGTLAVPGGSAGALAGAGGDSAAAGAGAAGAGAAGAGAAGAGAAGAAGAGGTGGAAGTGGSAGASGAPAAQPVDTTACVPGLGNKLYVSPTGSAQGDGKAYATAYDFDTARGLAMPGDTILLQPGKYVVPYVEGQKNSIVLSRSGEADGRIRVIAEGGRAEFDFSFPEQAWVQDSVGFLVSGSYWSMCRVDVTHAGYQGVYVTGQHNTFEHCAFYDNRNTGLEINKGGAYTTVINCDSYRNYDPKKLGGMADGFGPKETQGPGNRFYGCRAWENSDDGFDAYESPETVVIDRSFAFRNGVDVWGYDGFDGNGNGFKVGGASKQANHRLTRCAAFANRVKGFDQNNNTGGLTIYNSVAFDNGTNFGLSGPLNQGQRHDLRNNVAFGGPSSIGNALEQNNSWTLNLTVSAADFKDVAVESGAAPRAAGGGLPETDFLQLAEGSALIDAGVDVALPFNGKAPDLGAFEAP